MTNALLSLSLHGPEVRDNLSFLQRSFHLAPPAVSFEFFPPKSLEMEAKLLQSIHVLAPLQPRFVSVTYGAGGSTRARTHQTVKRILADTNLTPAAHLTCVQHSRAEIRAIAQEYWDAGVRHIVALRGDAPGNGYAPGPDELPYADHLVRELKQVADFDISVAAYPEKHPTAASLDADIEHLKRKIDAGANRAITQFFFEVDVYLRFLEKVQKAGITAEIVPGILPVTNVAQLKKFAAMCGTNVPAWLGNLFEGLDEKPELRMLVSAYVAAEQCRLLALAGVENFHFYTLNRAELTLAICHVLGVREQDLGAKKTA
jgi:methylenetetrahydrofolate reductase (NADPH)